MADEEEMEVESKEGPRFVVKKWCASVSCCAFHRRKLPAPNSVATQATLSMQALFAELTPWRLCTFPRARVRLRTA
jgi:hypothetical protein